MSGTEEALRTYSYRRRGHYCYRVTVTLMLLTHCLYDHDSPFLHFLALK